MAGRSYGKFFHGGLDIGSYLFPVLWNLVNVPVVLVFLIVLVGKIEPAVLFINVAGELSIGIGDTFPGQKGLCFSSLGGSHRLHGATDLIICRGVFNDFGHLTSPVPYGCGYMKDSFLLHGLVGLFTSIASVGVHFMQVRGFVFDRPQSLVE